jgi:cytochrome c oxidase subunit III
MIGLVRPDAAAAPRASTPPALFGMVLFLASELMFFGGLFAAYFTLRSIAAEWPPADVELEMTLTVVATVMLTASSLTLHWGITRLRGGDDGGMRLWIGVTFLLGAAFLAIKFYEFATAGFGISSHAYGSLWFTILGVHAIHLLVGLALLAVVVARAARGVYAPGHTAGADAVGYYWHFVDVVWLAIFSTIYLIR